VPDVDEILAERGARYGNYLEQTKISSALMAVMHEALLKRGKTLAPDMQDCLIMTAVKISRIINGDPEHADNWADIAGYAKLVQLRLEGRERK
jgi:hypothetical protein